MNGPNQDESGIDTWSDTARDAFRVRVTQAIRSLPDDHDHFVLALRVMRRILLEESARALQGRLPSFIELTPHASATEALLLAERLDHDLAGIGLAVKHPETGAPMKLGVAQHAAPPASDKGWLVLEPFVPISLSRSSSAHHAANLPYRLPNLLMHLELVPEPTRRSLAQDGPPRSR